MTRLHARDPEERWKGLDAFETVYAAGGAGPRFPAVDASGVAGAARPDLPVDRPLSPALVALWGCTALSVP